jgi:hypothetical protein
MKTEKKRTFSLRKSKRNSLILTFNSIFFENEIKEEFLQFLKVSLHKEQFLFVCGFKEIKQTKERKTTIEKIKDLFENFLVEGSVHQIGVSDKQKTSILEVYESFQLEITESKNNIELFITDVIYKFLQPISTQFKKTLNELYWDKFLTTPTAEVLTKKFENNKAICIPLVIKEFTHHRDEYFDHPFIFDSDFDFAKYLLRDSSNWTSVEIQKNMSNAFMSPINYLPNVSYSENAETVKFECTVNASFQQLLLSFTTNSGRERAGGFITLMETFEYYDYQALQEIFKKNQWSDQLTSERELTVNCAHFHMPTILNSRIYHHSASMKYFPKEETLIVVLKPYVREHLHFFHSYPMEVCPEYGKPKKKMKAYSVFGLSFFKYQKIDEKSIKVSQVMIMDMGGWTRNEALAKKVITERSINFEQTLQKNLHKYDENSKIRDYEEKFKEGKVVDGLGRLLVSLKIGE